MGTEMYLKPYRQTPPLSAIQNGALAIGQYDVSPAHAALAVIYLVATAAGAYHGYKRNDSIGWGIDW